MGKLVIKIGILHNKGKNIPIQSNDEVFLLQTN